MTPEHTKAELHTADVGPGTPGSAAGQPRTSATPGERPGDTIGPYRLLSVLGEGGFGIVYLAERREPHVQRVALKIIKPGMDSRAVIARFEQERQALAVMDHPNVARVFDAGATPLGRPYFVMELVQGEAITTYCDRNKLSVRERLELFIPVCEAVQHAHTKGVIHRDLKPSNVLISLVDARAVPKVIDFGVSKAISHTMTANTIFTEQGQIIGTPEYMSPEQAELGAVDVDTRTDVYSLGVVLYELLTGSLPFETVELRRAGIAEIQRIIREVEPPRPSTKLSTAGAMGMEAAERRRMRVDSLAKELRSELEWIPLKAMRKERDRRYKTPSELAEDIRNYFEGKPLIAGPEARGYRARKFLRRNRGAVTGTAALLVGLIGAAAGTTTGFIKARESAREVRESLSRESQQRARAEATTKFLADMLSAVDPEKAKGREVTVRDVLDEAARRVGTGFVDQPVVEAAVRETLGETYYGMGRYPESREQLTRTLALREGTLGPDNPETMTTRFNLGAVALQMGDVEAASKILDETYQARKRVLGEGAEDTLVTRSLLGFVRQRAGDNEGALAIYRETLDIQRRTLGDEKRATLDTLSSIADVLQDLGRLEEAEKASAELVTLSRRAEGPEGKATLQALSIRGAILKDLARYEEAESITREALATKTRIFGEGHSETLTTANVLAQILEMLKKYDEAAAILKRTIDLSTAALGAEHQNTLTYKGNMARIEHLRGNLAEAERLMREELAVRRRVMGEESREAMISMNNLGLLLLDEKKAEEAEPIFRTMLANLGKSVPETHWIHGQARLNVGECLKDQRKFAEAEPVMLEGYERLTKTLPAGHERITKAAAAIGAMYEKWGKTEKAAEWKAKAGASPPPDTGAGKK